jgi:putative restriction endonuclease
MKYWWVNQKKTFRQEIAGGYMWSPKTKRNGSRNPYYDFMKMVSPGDLLFSYYNGGIGHLGKITSPAFTATKPETFGKAGEDWENEGWRVDVEYHHIKNPLIPADYVEKISPLLPEKYSPLTQGCKGKELYLTEVPSGLGDVLIQLIGSEALSFVNATRSEEEEALKEEDESRQIEQRILSNEEIGETERKALRASRIGQGKFKENVFQIEKSCRVTGVRNPQHLIASHIKPWKESNNSERLDGNNGFLMTPHVDHLFDRGFISFGDDGKLLISPSADKEALSSMGIPLSGNIGNFNEQQKHYLSFHREHIFRTSESLL